jgi:trimeric autotransporter adhesin
MSSTTSKLRLAGALAALAALALAASCTGFFVPEQLASITISPSTANVPLAGTTQLEAFGTNTDSTSAGNITGKVSWTSSSGAISINGSGVATGNELTTSPVTITAEYQGVSATATGNVCAQTVSNFAITLLPGSSVTEGTAVTATAMADVSGVGSTDISSDVQWSTNNSLVTITNGDPAEIDTSSVTSTVTVEIIGTYSCNGINSPAFQTPLTVTVTTQ